jgi:lipoate-protein ligase A
MKKNNGELEQCNIRLAPEIIDFVDKISRIAKRQGGTKINKEDIISACIEHFYEEYKKKDEHTIMYCKKDILDFLKKTKKASPKASPYDVSEYYTE